ncbi:hypothetical protein C8R46DRAFT_1209719 [Mycena filopes]|nr:hypothetical protein C8R46DRAFT_1209719 [Mycena filopes]
MSAQHVNQILVAAREWISHTPPFAPPSIALSIPLPTDSDFLARQEDGRRNLELYFQHHLIGPLVRCGLGTPEILTDLSTALVTEMEAMISVPPSGLCALTSAVRLNELRDQRQLGLWLDKCLKPLLNIITDEMQKIHAPAPPASAVNVANPLVDHLKSRVASSNGHRTSIF